MTSNLFVETMDFSAQDAPLADVADRVRRIHNEVCAEIVKVMRLMNEKPTRVHRERMALELERAAMLFRHAEPCFVRLAAIVAAETTRSLPTPDGALTGAFDLTWPVTGNNRWSAPYDAS